MEWSRFRLGPEVDRSDDVKEQGPEAAGDALEAEAMVTTKTPASVTTRPIFWRRAVVRRHERLEPVAFPVPVMFPDRTSLEKIPEHFIFQAVVVA